MITPTIREFQRQVIVALAPVFEQYTDLDARELKRYAIDAIVQHFCIDNSPYKTCTRCGQRQERVMFGRDSSKSDGLFTWCRQCRKS